MHKRYELHEMPPENGHFAKGARGMRVAGFIVGPVGIVLFIWFRVWPEVFRSVLSGFAEVVFVLGILLPPLAFLCIFGHKARDYRTKSYE